MATPQELADWALEVNNGGVPGREGRISFSEARTITAGMHDAWRQLILEVFILKSEASMTADEWFDENGPRKIWASEIRMAYEDWMRTKANGYQS